MGSSGASSGRPGSMPGVGSARPGSLSGVGSSGTSSGRPGSMPGIGAGSLPPSAPRPGSMSGAVRPLPGREAVRASERPPPPVSPTPSVPWIFPLGARVADAYLAMAALAYVEVYAVGFLSIGQFVGAFELGQASQGLAPVALVAAAPCALAGGAVVELMRRGDRRLVRATVTALAAAFAGVAAWGVAAGRHFEGGRRLPFALVLALAGGLAAHLLAPRVARLFAWVAAVDAPRVRVRRGATFLAAVLAIIVVVDAINVRVLPRLYPAFHLGLAGIALLLTACAGMAFASFDRTLRRREGWSWLLQGRLLRGAAAATVFAFGAARAPAAAKKLARLDNVRIIYLERAPVLSHVVLVAAALSPPPPIDDGPLPEPRQSGHAVDLSSRDILLVTIDALRADHVSAYGYARKTTPNIDKLAEGGVIFDAAYSPTPHTSYAITSIMTGKYMRPLVLQGLGEDSETWAAHLRRYGFRTAAFYPPAVFFIDAERFGGFRDRALDFEYRRIEFAPAADRAEAVRAYLAKQGGDRRVFLWVHLFEPHEPYEAHAEHAFGDRDVDRYDAEIASADAGLGAVVSAVRAQRPNAVVIVAADHGEEFGEHGGRYHGTTVYEEQVRVPLVVNAPGLLAPRRVSAPVQLVDLLPTVLAGLSIPRPARVRGTDLGPYLAGLPPPPSAAPSPGPSLPGFAFSETDTQTMLARGNLRLVCARKIGACALYDVERDPGEQTDVSAAHPTELTAMRAELRAVEASHGRYERQGLRSEGKGWPEALRRGLSGDGDAAADVAALLDDADVTIRRKAAEVLFELGRADASAALRLALVRDEDDEVRRWCALSLTRLGEGAPRVRDLLADPDVRWRRLAALALAESGDDRGTDTLVSWWREAYPSKPEPTPNNPDPKPPKPIPIPFERAREIAAALGKIKAKTALVPLIAALDDVRLRPYVARALAAINDEAARPALAERLRGERYQVARVALAEALVKLGAGPELRAPLVRFLGTPDPLPDGLRIATEAKVLDLVGGPRERDRDRLRRFATSGVAIGLVVPKLSKGDGEGARGLRVLCRARTVDHRAGEIRVGLRAGPPPTRLDRESLVPSAAPALDARRATVLAVPAGEAPIEVFAALPATVGVKPGELGDFVFYATQNVELLACAVVPLSEEIPPPPPEPWTPIEQDQ
ncbi:Choline-sulfatase [Minicystis rosea]|nr:Choline-sulfatase [Minicystis rosea]